MGHASGKPSDGFHFLGLAKLVAELALVIFIVPQRSPHPIESGGNLRDLVACIRTERMHEIPLFERIDAF